jgi:Helix-turn-helix.
MTTYDRRKKKLINELKDKEYRDAFVSEHIDTGIPFQIKAIREQRGWTQKQLGKNVHDAMKQEQISRLEDANYSKFSLATLKRLASAFDVGLMVKFVSISDLVKWELGLTSESLKAVSFDEDSYFEDKPGVANSALPTETEINTEKLPCIETPHNITPFSAIPDNQTSVQSNTLILISAQS